MRVWEQRKLKTERQELKRHGGTREGTGVEV